MQIQSIQRLYGSVVAIVLTISLIWVSFPASSSWAVTPNHSPTTNNNMTTGSTQLVAQIEDGGFSLPPLPYAYDALDTYIDAKTMMIHHDKHHAGYVNNLNAAIAQHPELKGQSVEALLTNLNTIPTDIRTAVRNNGGGHANHTMFWEIMTPNSAGKPTGALAQAINATFGDVETFKQTFNAAGMTRFGSGWVWLVLTQDGKLEITSTANQDSPLLEGNFPIMGNDVWEHAYYLKYQNKRAEYLNAWWNVVDWDEVSRRFEEAKRGL